MIADRKVSCPAFLKKSRLVLILFFILFLSKLDLSLLRPDLYYHLDQSLQADALNSFSFSPEHCPGLVYFALSGLFNLIDFGSFIEFYSCFRSKIRT